MTSAFVLLQDKVVKLLAVIKQGRNVSTELRNSRSCRNPEILRHKEDYYDRLAAEFQQWRDRKAQQQNQRVEFVKGGTEKAPAGPGGLQAKAQVAAMQAKAQAVVAAAQHKGGRNKWDSGPGR